MMSEERTAGSLFHKHPCQDNPGSSENNCKRQGQWAEHGQNTNKQRLQGSKEQIYDKSNKVIHKIAVQNTQLRT